MNPTTRQGPPTIVKAAEQLLFEIERAVAAFPRKHRYQLGADLRSGAVDAVLLSQQAYRAMRDRPRQAGLVDALALVVDKLKLQLQVAQRLQCCSFARFELLARMAIDVGRQCGGWKRQISSLVNGQNPQAAQTRSHAERAETLSTRAAQPSGAYA